MLASLRSDNVRPAKEFELSTTVANKDKTMQQAVTSGGNPIPNQAKIKRAYDYIVVGSGAAGSIIAGEHSKKGADNLVV
jgi:hypothetical protein